MRQMSPKALMSTGPRMPAPRRAFVTCGARRRGSTPGGSRHFWKSHHTVTFTALLSSWW
uniref:Uncharacterized protein n=1 Tax=Arundo donax TaxID=35708 RepID=A0A0A9HTN0_ARUDO